MITLYAGHNLPFPQKGIVRDIRPMWALEELQMPYTFHWLDAMKREQAAEAHLAVNPFGTIPSFTDGDVTLYDSAAIVHYLYDKAGKLPRQAEDCAQLLQCMFAAVNTVEPPLLQIFLWNAFWKDRPGRAERYPEVVDNAKWRLAGLARALGTKPFLMGDAFGPADIMMVHVIGFAHHEANLVDGFPAVKAYVERCTSRPSHRAALAKQGTGPAAAAA